MYPLDLKLCIHTNSKPLCQNLLNAGHQWPISAESLFQAYQSHIIPLAVIFEGVSASDNPSCMAATIFFSSVVVSLIIDTSVAKPCNVVLILVTSASKLSRQGGLPEAPSSSCGGLLRVVMRPVLLKYFDADI